MCPFLPLQSLDSLHLSCQSTGIKEWEWLSALQVRDCLTTLNSVVCTAKFDDCSPLPSADLHVLLNCVVFSALTCLALPCPALQ
jgi:hypothetical protein